MSSFFEIKENVENLRSITQKLRDAAWTWLNWIVTPHSLTSYKISLLSDIVTELHSINHYISITCQLLTLNGFRNDFWDEKWCVYKPTLVHLYVYLFFTASKYAFEDKQVCHIVSKQIYLWNILVLRRKIFSMKCDKNRILMHIHIYIICVYCKQIHRKVNKYGGHVNETILRICCQSVQNNRVDSSRVASVRGAWVRAQYTSMSS